MWYFSDQGLQVLLGEHRPQTEAAKGAAFDAALAYVNAHCRPNLGTSSGFRSELTGKVQNSFANDHD
jgi:hypothetical protein